MDPKYKTLIPLVVIFFIFGIAVGYVAHKPVTTVTVTPVPTPSPTPTPTPSPTPSPTPTPTPIPTPTEAATPSVSNFTVKDYYDSSKDIPTYTIQLSNWGANPNTLSIRPGDSVLIKIADSSLSSPLTLILNSYSKDLGTSGVAFITFNKIGVYSFKAVIPSGDPNVLPVTYAKGTISVH